MKPSGRPRYCVLDENGEIQPASLEQWARFMESPQRVIEQEDFKGDEYLVSTVFLGLDHNYGRGKGLYFETMVFGPPHVEILHGKAMMLRESLWTKRVSTLQEAKEAHVLGVQWLKEECPEFKGSGPHPI